MGLTSAQLAIRRDKIFSTDAPIICGWSARKTKLRLWLEKTGSIEPEEPGEEAEIGLLIQPVIGALYQKRTGRTVVPFDDTLIHPEIPWMGSHFDFRAADRLVEAKAFSAYSRRQFGEAGTGDVPLYILAQVMHEMHVAGERLCDIAVLFGGQSFEIFTVAYDHEVMELLLAEELAFHQLLVSGEPPEPRTGEDAALLYRKHKIGKTVVSTPTLELCLSEMARAKALASRASRRADEMASELKLELGDAEALVSPDGEVLATWRAAKDSSGYDLARLEREQSAVLEGYRVTVPGSRRFINRRKQDGEH